MLVVKKFVATLNSFFFYNLLIFFIRGKTDHHH